MGQDVGTVVGLYSLSPPSPSYPASIALSTQLAFSVAGRNQVLFSVRMVTVFSPSTRD